MTAALPLAAVLRALRLPAAEGLHVNKYIREYIQIDLMPNRMCMYVGVYRFIYSSMINYAVPTFEYTYFQKYEQVS